MKDFRGNSGSEKKRKCVRKHEYSHRMLLDIETVWQSSVIYTEFSSISDLAGLALFRSDNLDEIAAVAVLVTDAVGHHPILVAGHKPGVAHRVIDGVKLRVNRCFRPDTTPSSGPVNRDEHSGGFVSPGSQNHCVDHIPTLVYSFRNMIIHRILVSNPRHK